MTYQRSCKRLRGFLSPLWGGGNPDIGVLEYPPPCPSPTRGRERYEVR